ncbi:MAG: HDOD domain-containing protein [Deltaproteobacteria bacterium]|nr:HDOD domain-containing protein [Deltaproteobacteria bacterium]MBW1922097.1 HDOD domain-containing protein [Deltaproteobacteria bacterium]MBW1947914.1 HDOD domain-containing protein [Deltaproteobacteria bacterium]MBW2007250.1 HDOD domain-containing protein [Deltaproteobacteria bacterium]MBW2102395.1 HDOD domain-containing protein [Deltaproteobacteria bacterium]
MNPDIIIKNLDNLKPVPHVLDRLIRIAEDPDSSMADLGQVIEHDPALTANILKVCNSSFFGLSKRVESVRQAVNLLGIDQVIDIALLQLSGENFRGEQKGYNLQRGELWRYSVSSALMARLIAERKGMEKTHLVFTSSLLKDIGKVVLSVFVKDSLDRIEAMVSRDDVSFLEAEKAVLGIDHAELGALVAEKWRFSDEMVEIIRNHHPGKAGARVTRELSAVYLADILCMMMGLGGGTDGLAYWFHREIADSLGFSEQDLEAIMAAFSDEVRRIGDLGLTA